MIYFSPYKKFQQFSKFVDYCRCFLTFLPPFSNYMQIKICWIPLNMIFKKLCIYDVLYTEDRIEHYLSSKFHVNALFGS